MRRFKIPWWFNLTYREGVLFREWFNVTGREPINDYLDRQRVSYFARIKKLPITRLCKLVLMEVEYSNTSSDWKYVDHLKLMKNKFQMV
jgi:hypothetical protein